MCLCISLVLYSSDTWRVQRNSVTYRDFHYLNDTTILYIIELLNKRGHRITEYHKASGKRYVVYNPFFQMQNAVFFDKSLKS